MWSLLLAYEEAVQDEWGVSTVEEVVGDQPCASAVVEELWALEMASA